MLAYYYFTLQVNQSTCEEAFALVKVRTEFKHHVLYLMGWQGFECYQCPLWHWYYVTLSQTDAIFFPILPRSLFSSSITLPSRRPQCAAFPLPCPEPLGLLYNLMQLSPFLKEICLQLYPQPSILSFMLLDWRLFYMMHLCKMPQCD